MTYITARTYDEAKKCAQEHGIIDWYYVDTDYKLSNLPRGIELVSVNNHTLKVAKSRGVKIVNQSLWS